MGNNKHINKGTAFTSEEREELKIVGLIPTGVESLETQIRRCEEMIERIKMDDKGVESLMKYQNLSMLRMTNETLFYALLQKNVAKYMPLVYTPTVGLACERFSHIFTHRSEGLFIPHETTRDNIHKMLDTYVRQRAAPSIIVVTDGSRILGLGDLGINGMGIPVGKLALYVAVGGFHPLNILPITIDFGTDTTQHREDPLYVGKHEKRPSSEVFYKFTDEFMSVVSQLFPTCVIQFEDFENKHCFELLARNIDKYRCFNDDIQGTGVVAAAGIISALKYVEKEDKIKPQDHKIVFYGFGSATAGVANQISSCLHEMTKLPLKTLRNMFYMVDSKGLCTTHREGAVPAYKKDFTRTEASLPHGASLEKVVELIKPSVLIGLSGQGQTFTQKICRKMAENNKHPIIFALSNPTQKAECLFQDCYDWTNGSVVWAAGSPMDDVVTTTWEKKKKGPCKTVMTEKHHKRHSPQGNNLYAFPGIGFGAWACQAKKITPKMLTAATNAISDAVKEKDLLELFPELKKVANVSDIVASEVMRVAKEEGLARCQVPATHELRMKLIKDLRYKPEYDDL